MDDLSVTFVAENTVDSTTVVVFVHVTTTVYSRLSR